MAESFRVAPYGPTAWIWTISFIAGLLFFGARTIDALTKDLPPDPFDGGLAFVLVPLLIYAWIRSTKGYRLEAGNIVIDRVGPGKINIPIAEIESAQSRPDLGSFFNVGFLSIGGVFGWAGRVRVRKPADVKSLDADVFGTNPKNQLLLEMKNGANIILTPADPQAMETSLRVAGVGTTQVSEVKRGRSVKRKT